MTARDVSDDDEFHFVLNSHGLGFDQYSLLCIKSLRRVCGPDVRISVYCPTNLPPPSDDALAFYDRYEVGRVTFRNEYLPDHLEDASKVPARHLTYNKLYTLQGVASGERRIFLDSDIVVLSDPRPRLRSIVEPALVVAVDTPESFPGDWHELYAELDTAFPEETIEVWETYAHGDCPEPRRVEIPPFFCSTVVGVDHRSTLPSEWRRVCGEIERRIELLPRSFFVDQVGLSVAVQRTGQPWHLLPRSFNAAYEIRPYLSEMILFHYVTLDTLAAATARFPEVERVVNEVVRSLAEEDGVDLRFQVLTQWPRWYRRGLGIASRAWERVFGRPLKRVEERR